MEPNRYAEEAAILDRFLTGNNLTEQEAWDRLIRVLYEARELKYVEFSAQVDPLFVEEVLLDVAELPPRQGFLSVLWENPALDLKSLLVDDGGPLEILPYLYLLVEPLLDMGNWGDEDREPHASSGAAQPLAEYGLSLVQSGKYSFKSWSEAMLEKFGKADVSGDRLRDILDEVLEQFQKLERLFMEQARLQAATSGPAPELSPGQTPLTEAQIRQFIREEKRRASEKNAREAEEELRALGFFDLAGSPPDSAN